MTKAALDSAYAPTDAQIAAAKAAGYVAWFGYFKFGNDGVLNGWSDADFRRVLAGGLQTMAYCSGWADPSAVKARAAGLLIRSCLDDESGMRPDGSWVQAWLDASGGGLYGNYWVHAGRAAPFHVLAAYPTSGDPSAASWWSLTPRPDGLCAWQFAGSHVEFGITVDTTWLDDGFFAFSAAGQELGGDLDMATADQILAAVTMPPPPRPASVASASDAALIDYANTAGVTWDAVAVKYGPDGRDYIYRLIHPLSIAQAIAGLKIGVDQASLAAVLAKLDDLAAHPAVVSDPALAAQVASLAKHLGVGTA